MIKATERLRPKVSSGSKGASIISVRYNESKVWLTRRGREGEQVVGREGWCNKSEEDGIARWDGAPEADKMLHRNGASGVTKTVHQERAEWCTVGGSVNRE